MKGIVFTEFIEMVEERFSPEVADDIITAANLPSGGSYTGVATYDHRELLSLVQNLSKVSGIAVPELVREFGRHLFQRFVKLFPQLFVGIDSPAEFLRGIEDHIHVEVRKLYPDTELPTFAYRDLGPDSMELTYRSSRPFADLAEGLIAGCCEHFNVPVEIRRTGGVVRGETEVRFCVTFSKQPALAN